MKVTRELLQWRCLVAVLLPPALAYGVCSYFDQSPLVIVLVLSFIFMVVPSFVRVMARAQARADLRAEVARLRRDYFNILEMIRYLPPEDREPYLERIRDMELRLMACIKVLEERP